MLLQLEEFKKRKQAALAKKHPAGSGSGQPSAQPSFDTEASALASGGSSWVEPLPAPPGLSPREALPPGGGTPRAPFFAAVTQPAATADQLQAALPPGEPLSYADDGSHPQDAASQQHAWQQQQQQAGAAAGSSGSQEAESLRAQVGELLQSVDQLHKALQVRTAASQL